MTQSANALSRFRTQESAIKAPGSCLTCKSFKGPFVDPGIQLFQHGSVYLCVKCIREMADNLGLLDLPEPVEIKPDLDEANQIVNDYLAHISGLSDLLVAAHGALSRIATEAAERREEEPAEPVIELPDAPSEQGAAGIPSDSSSDEPELGAGTGL